MPRVVQQDMRYVGMIRTISFLKSIGLFDNERIAAIVLAREIQKKRDREKVRDVIYRDTCTTEAYTVDWDASVNGGSFPTFPSDKVTSLIHKAALGDFVVQSVRYRFTSPKLANYLNDEIRARAIAKDKDLRDVVFLAENIEFYATYTRTHSDDLRVLPYLKELNQHEIEAFKFKLGVLDLTELVTERSVKYGEKEHINVTDDPSMVRYVLMALNWDGWPVAKRTLTLGGAHVVVKPACLREYHMTAARSWSLSGQKEVE